MKPWQTLAGLLTLLMVSCLGLWPQIAAAQKPPRTRDLLRTYIKKIDQKQQKEQLASAVGLPDVDGGIVALEYAVLLERDGQETPVRDPGQYEFQVGDKIRVQIQPLVDVYIYIFHEGASGKQVCLLPQDQEQSPLAKAGEKLDLPNDGSFVFAEPPGAEKLIVVAAQSPNQDLAALTNVVFKKDESELTEEEKKVKKQLSGTFEQMLKSVSDKQRKAAKHRGLLTDQALRKFAAGKPKTRAIIEEPPSDHDSSTFAMAANSRSGGKPELFLSIPLKSISTQPPASK